MDTHTESSGLLSLRTDGGNVLLTATTLHPEAEDLEEITVGISMTPDEVDWMLATLSHLRASLHAATNTRLA